MTQPQQRRPPETPQQLRERLGRPSLLTPERQEHIVRLVRAGSYLNVAAQHAGIGRSTLMLWLQRGRAAAALRDAGEELPDSELLYLDFLDAVTRADTEAEVTAATAWRAAFTTDWRAARDYLVRRHPDRWAATQRVSISSEESEQRIDRAVGELLAILDGDGDPLDLPAELDLDTDERDL